MAKQPSDYTLAEIKDILREKKLSTIGNKAELINRLTNSDLEIWTTLDGLRSRQRHGVMTVQLMSAMDRGTPPQTKKMSAKRVITMRLLKIF